MRQIHISVSVVADYTGTMRERRQQAEQLLATINDVLQERASEVQSAQLYRIPGGAIGISEQPEE